MNFAVIMGAAFLLFVYFVGYYAHYHWKLRSLFTGESKPISEITGTEDSIIATGTIRADTRLTDPAAPISDTVRDPVLSTWVIQKRDRNGSGWKTVDGDCRATTFTLETDTGEITVDPESLTKNDGFASSYGEAFETYDSPHFAVETEGDHGTTRNDKTTTTITIGGVSLGESSKRARYTTLGDGDEISVSGTPVVEQGTLHLTGTDEMPLSITDLDSEAFKRKYTWRVAGYGLMTVVFLTAGIGLLAIGLVL